MSSNEDSTEWDNEVPRFSCKGSLYKLIASFPGPPLASAKNGKGGGEPGTDSHVTSRLDAGPLRNCACICNLRFALTIETPLT